MESCPCRCEVEHRLSRRTVRIVKTDVCDLDSIAQCPDRPRRRGEARCRSFARVPELFKCNTHPTGGCSEAITAFFPEMPVPRLRATHLICRFRVAGRAPCGAASFTCVRCLLPRSGGDIAGHMFGASCDRFRTSSLRPVPVALSLAGRRAGHDRKTNHIDFVDISRFRFIVSFLLKLVFSVSVDGLVISLTILPLYTRYVGVGCPSCGLSGGVSLFGST